MAQLPMLRTRLKELLDFGLADESVTVHAVSPGRTPVPPAIVIAPKSSSFDDITNTRGLDRYEVDLQVMVPIGDAESAQEELDEFLADDGPNSIRRILTESRDLGLNDGTDVTVDSMTYGLSFGNDQQLSHLGAAVRLVVLTTG